MNYTFIFRHLVEVFLIPIQKLLGGNQRNVDLYELSVGFTNQYWIKHINKHITIDMGHLTMKNGKESLLSYNLQTHFPSTIWISRFKKRHIGVLVFQPELKFFRIDFCMVMSKLTITSYCIQAIYKSLCRIKVSSFNFIV